ncbi:MAG: hypothetical protein JWM98_1881 [Thermoleophilia bacterium]|nr:hypothetical protein [Thermoleophilia bacterium]
MADEQTPQSDLIDDAIRQAERQLEEKLEALRMSALAEPTPPSDPVATDIAVLRPTQSSRASEPAPPAPEAATAWEEAPGHDVTFAPSEGTVTLSGTELYVPDAEDPSLDDADAVADDATDAPHTTSLTADVHDLVAVWDDEDAPAPAADTPVAWSMPDPVEPAAPTAPPHVAPSHAVTPDRADRGWDTPEPVHSSWTRATGDHTRPVDGSPTSHALTPQEPTPVGPTEEELQFWAHTRTALRNLQQFTEHVPGMVAADVAAEVERVVRDELAPTGATLRLVQQQVQGGLPKLAERIEGSIEQALTSPDAGIRQIREELPMQLDRTVRETRTVVREELDHTASTLHAAMAGDVGRLEDSIASNVTRMAQGTTDSVARVERDLELLGEGVARFERSLGSEFERVEDAMRASIERAEHALADQIAEPAATIRRLDAELPERLSSVERTLVEQLRTSQRDVSNVLGNLVDANRASLDRVAAIASTLDEDRSRRSEDVEVIVDAVTTGWEGLAGAVKVLFEQHERTSEQVAGIEARLGQLRDLEGAVEGTMAELRDLVRNLTPAPVVVTVSHPEATVQNTSRGGWLADSDAKD